MSHINNNCNKKNDTLLFFYKVCSILVFNFCIFITAYNIKLICISKFLKNKNISFHLLYYIVIFFFICLYIFYLFIYFQILQLRQRRDSIPIKLRNQYNLLKKECRRALNKWWNEKTKEAEKLAEINMKLSRGGFLLKSLKSIGRSRHIQYQSLLNSDGATKISTSKQKLQRWHQYFTKLINVDTKLTML